MGKITVVVPVYNTGTTVKKCVDSVLQQTYTDFEVLLINDGSPDNSDEICRELSQKDSRIRYFKRENCGLAAVRNFGIDNAKGEYICFIDSDDYIDGDCLEFMYNKACETKADIVLCSYYLENQGVVTPIKITEAILNADNINEHIVELKSKNVIDTACNKLYNLEFLRKSGVIMPVGEYYEDTAFNLTLLKSNPLISVYNKCFYHYILHAGSITRRYNPEKLNTIKERARLLKSVTSGVDGYCDFYYIKCVFSAIIDMFLSLKRREILQNIKSEIFTDEFLSAANNAYFGGISAKLIIKSAQSKNVKTVYYFCKLSYILKYKMQRLFLKVKGK